VLSNANIVVDDSGIPTSAGEYVTVPGQSSDTVRVSIHLAKLLLGTNIPEHGLALLLNKKRKQSESYSTSGFLFIRKK